MRALCSTTSGAGHYRPLFPVARALRDVGHDIVFCCPESSADAVSGAGFEVRPFDDTDGPTPEQRELFERAAATGDAHFGEIAVGLGFGYVSPMAALSRLREAFDDWRPDLVVRDPGEFASLMLCEQRDLPSVIAMGGLQSTFSLLGGLVGEPLSRLRVEVGVDDVGALATDRLILTATPETFDEPSEVPVEILRYRVGAPLRRIPAHGGIYATLGTEVMGFFGGPPLMRTILEVLGAMDAGAVVTTAVEPSDLDLPATAPHVSVRRFVAHDEVIPASRAVITHGGAGTVQDALLMGRPMVVLPQFADQNANGRRVAEVGVGRVLYGDEQTADGLADALADVMGGRFDDRSWSLAEEAATLPELVALVSRLEALAS